MLNRGRSALVNHDWITRVAVIVKREGNVIEATAALADGFRNEPDRKIACQSRHYAYCL
ncbi:MULTISPECIES: hypothetical protein [unclassified Sporosarcina]|uniref:hypothetical protein n=1 Tax=unclassified Sporosarcina TaxID=2647733 RepID=UPI0012DC5081|nr:MULTISPECIES: hypothetical protein [unclassified Sporosarcina]